MKYALVLQNILLHVQKKLPYIYIFPLKTPKHLFLIKKKERLYQQSIDTIMPPIYLVLKYLCGCS
jgi:hypothetical protein